MTIRITTTIEQFEPDRPHVPPLTYTLSISSVEVEEEMVEYINTVCRLAGFTQLIAKENEE